MRVIKTITEEDFLKEYFGPVQEAARKPSVGQCLLEEEEAREEARQSSTEWCELSELRLSALICEFKPAGVNRSFNVEAITERMNKIFDTEEPQSSMYVKAKDQCAFMTKVKGHQNAGDKVTLPTTYFTPKYGIRPSLEMVEEKLTTWFGMKTCEDNESFPPLLCELSDFTIVRPETEGEDEEEYEGEEEVEGEEEQEDEEEEEIDDEEEAGPSTSAGCSSEPSISGAQPAKRITEEETDEA